MKNNRRGASWLEFLCFGLLIFSGYLGELTFSRYGMVPGIIGMLGFPIGLILFIELLAWLEREIIIGRKPFPKCICGGKEIDELDTRTENGRSLQICTCGRKYERKYAGRIIIIENDGESEFARWKPFRRWECQ